MKKISLFALLFFAINSLFAQKMLKSESDVPTAIVDVFKKDFKDAQNVTWYKDRHHFYAAYLNKENMERMAFYNDKNVMEKSRMEIKKEDIPTDVFAKMEPNMKKKGDRRYFKEVFSNGKYEYWVQTYMDAKDVDVEIFNDDGSLFVEKIEHKHK